MSNNYNLGNIVLEDNGTTSVGSLYGAFEASEEYSGAYLASTYQVGLSTNSSNPQAEDGNNAVIKRISNVSDLYTLIRNLLTGNKWVVPSGANLPTLNI